MARLSNAYQAVLRSYVDSSRIARVGFVAEALYLRLLMVSDGYGRFYGVPFRIAADAMGSRMESGDVDVPRVESALRELEDAGLVQFYESEGRRFVQIADYYDGAKGSRRTAKFPAPGTDGPPPGDVSSPTRGQDGGNGMPGPDIDTGGTVGGDCVSVPRQGTSGPPPGDVSSPLESENLSPENLNPEVEARARETTTPATWEELLPSLAPTLDTPEVRDACALYARHREEDPGLRPWVGAPCERDMAAIGRGLPKPSEAAACITEAVGNWKSFKDGWIRNWLVRHREDAETEGPRESAAEAWLREVQAERAAAAAKETQECTE